jgi:general secretion pathway protein G
VSKYFRNNRFSDKNKTSGFTLIELLVVIAIISILAALLMANFVGVRQRGRDAQRKSDLRQIQTALELYRADNGSYPLTLYATSCPQEPRPLTGGTVTYMQEIPCDPLDDSNYIYVSDGVTYSIYACLENENDADKDDTPQSCTSTVSFTVNNP